MSVFSAPEITTIQGYLTTDNYEAAYIYAADTAEGRPGVDQAVIVWLRGAAQINAGTGPFRDFVRSYSYSQVEHRFGVASSSTVNAQIQAASDSIAENVLGTIVSTGNLPSLSALAAQDAEPAATVLFDGQVGGWVGNPLFVLLGLDSPLEENILESPEGAYDALLMIKLLFTSSSITTSLSGLISLISSLGPLSPATDFAAAIASTTHFLDETYGGILTTLGVTADVIFNSIRLGLMDEGDQLTGTSQRNFIHGGAGADTIIGSGGSDIVDGGTDLDIADYRNSSEIIVTVKDEPSNEKYVGSVSWNGVDSLFGIESIVGSPDDDTFIIHSVPHDAEVLVVHGSGGNDTLSFVYFADTIEVNTVTLQAKLGEFTLDILGFEKFEGGLGDDKFVFSTGDVELDGRAGQDTADFSLSVSAVAFDTEAFSEVEIVHGSSFADSITTGDEDNQIFGRDGADTLSGGGGVDVLDGGDGADILIGGAGADYYVVSSGDVIADAELADRVGTSLTSAIVGVATREEGSSDPYEGMGFEFLESGGTLTIKSGSTTIATVNGWSTGELGIRLEEIPEDEEEEEPQEPDAPPSWATNINPDRRDPLVLDLDGDGLEFVYLSDSRSHFDLNNDGFRERVAWVAPDDGLLARDLDSNGLIDNQSELFGTTEKTAHKHLTEFDDNHDNVIDDNDDIFEDLLIWQDANQDGVSQSGELRTLDQAGITAVHLLLTNQGETYFDGDVYVRATSTYARADGQAWETASVEFPRQPLLSVWTPPPGFTLSAAAQALPALKGYGMVKDLSAAMTLDGTLRGLAEDLVTDLGTLSYADAREDFEALVHRWTGADQVGTSSRGAYINARHLVTVEQLTDTPFVEIVNSISYSDPSEIAAPLPEGVYQNAIDGLFLRFLAQVTTSSAQVNGAPFSLAGTPFAVAQAFTYNPRNDDLYWDVDGIVAALTVSAPQGASELEAHYLSGFSILRAIALGAEVTHTLDLLYRVATRLPGLDPQTVEVLVEAFGVHARLGGAGADQLTSVGTNTFVVAGDGDDILEGYVGASIYERVGQEIFEGGPGNDELNGYRGPDRYMFNLGDGSDVIVEGNGEGIDLSYDRSRDQLLLGPGLTVADVVVARDGDAAIISFKGLTEQLILVDQFEDYSDFYAPEGAFTGAGLEEIRFADGTIWTHQDVLSVYLENAATIGNDVIVGGIGAETLKGGAGDDALHGGLGADRYVWELGDGDDLIVEDTHDNSVTQADILEFGAGIAPGDVSVQRSGNDAVITFDGASGSITVRNHFYRPSASDAGYGVEEFHFANSTVWTRSQIDGALAADVYGTNDPETLSGSSDNDWIWGGDGDDTLEGGDGDDLLVGEEGEDLLIGGEGYDVAVYDSENDISVSVNENGEIEVDHWLYGTDVLVGIEKLIFADAGPDLDLAEYLGTYGTSGDDTLVGGAGRDRIFGLGGADSLSGGGGNDLLEGDEGNDTLLGGAGEDELHGQDGADSLSGGDDDDYLSGGDGDDTLEGGLGNDSLSGDEGSDTYVVTATSGDDAVSDWGSAGTDRLVIGPGVTPNDVIIARDYDTAILTLGVGGPQIELYDEFWSYEGEYGGYGIEEIAFDNSVVWSRGDLLAAYLANAATAGDDHIVAGVGDETLAGGAGNDLLEGRESEDTYVWNLGDGNDVILEDTQPDSLTPAGIDRLTFGPGIDPADVVVERVGVHALVAVTGEPGSILIRNHFYRPTPEAVGYGIEEFVFDDTTVWNRSQIDGMLVDDVIGTSVSETLTGTSSADHLWGDDGDDTLSGGDGDDMLAGEGGANVIDGGLGLDHAVYSDRYGIDITANIDGSVSVYVYATETTDILTGVERLVFANSAGEFAIGSSLADTIAVGSDVSHVYGFEGNDLITGGAGDQELNGGGGNDSLSGGAGDDDLSGEDGDDTLSGGDGDDYLYGGDGDDSLQGGAGDDDLEGGYGDDTLSGGDGADRFFFWLIEGEQIILDFESGDGDKIFVSSDFLEDFQAFLGAADQDGSDVLIDLGPEGSIRLVGTLLSSLSANDFEFD